jgi:hypothetical protein
MRLVFCIAQWTRQGRRLYVTVTKLRRTLAV